MDDGTYKAQSNGLTPEANEPEKEPTTNSQAGEPGEASEGGGEGQEQQQSPEDAAKAQDQRNIENNANNLRNAANVAMKTKNPYAMAAGAIVKGADKLTGGKSSELVGKGINEINKRVPMGNKIQEASNKLNESGASDAVGAATSQNKAEQKQKAMSAAKKASTYDGGNDKAQASAPPKKSKSKKLLLLLSIPAIFTLFMPMFMIMLSPNLGSMLDLTSKGGDVSNSSSNANASAYTKAEVENLLIYMGDSRIVGMMSSISNKSVSSIAEVGAGYSWFTSTAIPQLESMKNGKKFVVLAFGVNDLGNSASYLDKYLELKSNNPEMTFYVMSVNPVDEAKEAENGYTVTNADIEKFNSTMQDAFSEIYIDVYSQIKSDFGTEDGVHYDSQTYIKIHDIVVNYILSKNKRPGGTSEFGYPSYTESTELKGQSLLEAIGQDGVTELENKIKNAVGSGCTGNSVAAAAIALIDGLHAKGFHLPYYYGGGHVQKNPIVNPNWGANIGASKQKPSGSYDYYSGLDCSGFVMWAMHAANIGVWAGASDFLNLGDHVSFSKLVPGDVIANSGHVILVLENTGSSLITAESTGGGVQYGNYSYSSASSYTGISMSGYFANHCGG